MSNWTVQDRITGEIVYAYGADSPSHFAIYPLDTFNHILEVPATVEPITRRVTRVQLVARMGDAAFKELLSMSKSNVDVEAMMKLIEWATPEQDGTSIDLDDPHFAALPILEQALVAKGIVSAGWAASVVA